jgi:hypothetical protein
LTMPIHASESTTSYRGTHNGHPIELIIKTENAQGKNIITSTINTPKIKETNITVLKNNQLETMHQVTNNEVDDVYFNWNITQSKKGYTIDFKRNPYNEFFTTDVSGPVLSLQGLIYAFQNENLVLNKVITANLIIPWKTILPIRFIVKKEDAITIQNKRIDTLKIDLEINHILGGLLPKTSIWVTQNKPHILVKQEGLNKSYEITALPMTVTQPEL